jgi:hypothetical protein
MGNSRERTRGQIDSSLTSTADHAIIDFARLRRTRVRRRRSPSWSVPLFAAPDRLIWTVDADLPRRH